MSVPPRVLVLRLAPIAPATRGALRQWLGPVRFTEDGAECDLGTLNPEEVLSACAALGVRVCGSRVRQC
ncbi:MAG: hypothetical protein H6R40_58 [Gemmatimonadetes bacterium]|nr:hypothetical protein [Gemmatimonadota bacterium]